MSQVARHLFVTPQAIAPYVKMDGCPVEVREGKKLIHLERFIRWREARDREAARPTTLAGLEEARTRRESAMAELAELELATKRGELMTKTTFETVVGTRAEHLDARLRGFPGQVAPLCGGLSVQEVTVVLERAIETLRGELRGDSD